MGTPLETMMQKQGQECIVDWQGRKPQGWGNYSYEENYCELAYEILSSTACATKADLCVAFHCSKPTIVRWIRTYPKFREAVECGLAAGEKIFRRKIADHTFQPTGKVNNGLIKMMAANVYGIQEDISPLLVVNTNPTKNTTAEEEMIERGIPMPSFTVPDMDSDPGSGNCIDCDLGGQESETPLISFPAENDQEICGEKEGEGKGEDNCPEGEETSLKGVDTNSEKHGTQSIASRPTARPIARPFTDRERAMLLENLKLVGQVRAQEELLNKVKLDSGRGVKGFGSDFSSSDENVVNPFGTTVSQKSSGLSRFNK